MDIVLERMLSLIPRKPNGDFVHGGKTIFAKKIGLNHPQIISDWIGERSQSYNNYIYQTAVAYDVSPHWLKGETDVMDDASWWREGSAKQKSSPPEGEELSPAKQELKRLIEKASENSSEEELEKIVRVMKAVLGEV